MVRIKIGRRSYSIRSLFAKYARGVLLIYFVGILVMPFRKKRDRIVTVGHTYNGNAKAFSEWLADNTSFEVGFACDNPHFYKELSRKNLSKKVRILSLQSLKDCIYISGAKTICTTHGPSFFKPWGNRKNRPLFIGLWHGVGFKGTMRKNVRSMDFFDGFFVSSPFFKKLHEKWGFPPDKLYVAGYSRTDGLVNSRVTENKISEILAEYGIRSEERKVILFAPTWKKKDNGKLGLFGKDLEEGLADINNIALKNNSIVVFRPHINSDISLNDKAKKNLVVVSSSKYPDTEKLLSVTDLLITDWSSIFTDYLALNRPMIFLDSKPEFKMTGLSNQDRPGEKVSSVEQLDKAIKRCFSESYPDKKTMDERNRVIDKAWGTTLDGKSSQRYYDIICKLLNRDSKI